MKIYKKTEHPEMVPDEHFSVDVITCDSDGLINLGYYNYADKEWNFHSDTMRDYTNVEFTWIYPPVDKMKKALISTKE